MPCLVRMPAAQCSDSLTPPRPVMIEAGAALVFGADLEAGGVDDAVELVFLARDHDAVLGDPLDALAVGIDQMRARRVERLQIGVMEARPLAELAIPGLELLPAVSRSPTMASTRRADFLHLLEVGVLERRQHVRRRCAARAADP